jgi:hypothetical protein
MPANWRTWHAAGAVRSDLVFVLTDVNSHNAVHIAKRTARQFGRPFRIVRRFGPSQLAAYLPALTAASAQRDDTELPHAA